MTRPIALALTAGAVLALAPPPARGDFKAVAGTTLQLTQYRSDADPTVDVLERGDGDEGPGQLWAAASVSAGLLLSDGSASASAGLTAPGGPLALRTYATGSASSVFIPQVRQTASTFFAVAMARWHDTLTVDSGGVVVESVFVTVKVTGELSEVGNSVAEVGAGGWRGVGLTGPGTVTFEVSLWGNTGVGEYDLALQSNVFGRAQAVSQNGDTTESDYAAATSDFSHTMTITSVLVKDAGGNLVTPESLGYTLRFDSGMASPNLLPAAVPEPASLALLGVGAAGLVGGRLRRRSARIA